MLSDAVPSRAPRRISSRNNPNIARYRAAARGEAPDQLLLDGPHLVADALAEGLPLEAQLFSPRRSNGLRFAD
jgi:hypothetical protein